MTRNDAAHDGAHVPAHGDSVRLADLLLESLKALAAAGQADTACRLAGHACALYRTTDEAAWHKFNALLHRLSRYV